MKYIIDNDLHIHTCLSICSKDEGQTPDALLEYAATNGLKNICVTDHYWDSAVPCNTAVNWWYEKQNFDHISKNLPLPKHDGVRFLFGCEADMDSDDVIGLPKERYDDFDFIVVATTHFHHMAGDSWSDTSNEAIAGRWVRRMRALLDSGLPYHKVGIAHPVCPLMNKKSREDYLETLSLIGDDDLHEIFARASSLGVGIEINSDDMRFEDNEADTVLRVFRVAKEHGCKFYLGSDAHYRSQFAKAIEVFDRAINLLGLTEDDKFIV